MARRLAPDPRALGTGEIVTGLAGIALLVAMFLPWYRVAPGGVEPLPGGELVAGPEMTRNAWESFAVIDVFLALAAAMAIAMMVLVAVRASVALCVTVMVFTVPAGVAAIVLVALRLAARPGDDVSGTEPWAWVGLGAAVAIVVGSLIALRDEATDRSTSGPEAAETVRLPPPPPSDNPAGGTPPEPAAPAGAGTDR